MQEKVVIINHLQINSTEAIKTDYLLAAAAVGSSPFWFRSLQGGTCCRIERYLCNTTQVSFPAFEHPVLITQFGGKRVLSKDTKALVTSFPSVATFIPKGHGSSWLTQGALDFALIYFEGPTKEFIFDQCTNVNAPMRLKSSLCCSLSKELIEILSEQESSHNDEKLWIDHIDSLSSALVHQICYEIRQPATKRISTAVRGHVQYVHQALDYIHDNIGDSLRSEEIASQVGLRQSHFRKLFNQLTGSTLHSYILDKRLEYAKELLVSSSLSLAEIAEESGFSNQSHMASCFRKKFDETPAAFRRS